MVAALRLHSMLAHSRANGPGIRAVLWTQGCSLGCPGCFNPETHTILGGRDWSIDDLFTWLKTAEPIAGITLTGGEPLEQLPAVLHLLRRIRIETAWSAILFTGFTLKEVQRLPQAAELLACVDVLIAGRFDPTRRLAQGLRGSANKILHFLTDRYTPADLAAVPPAEVQIDVDGTISLTGIHPLRTW